MSDHTWLILGYILVSCYDVNGIPMNQHDFDFFHSVHNSYVLHASKPLLQFNTAIFMDQGYIRYSNVYRRST